MALYAEYQMESNSILAVLLYNRSYGVSRVATTTITS